MIQQLYYPEFYFLNKIFWSASFSLPSEFFLQSQFTIVFFFCSCFLCCRKSDLTQVNRVFSFLIITSLISLLSILVYICMWFELMWNSVVFHIHIQLFFSICRKQVFPLWITWAPWLKINRPYMCTFISGLSICFPFIYMPIFILVPHYLGDCSFIVTYEVRQYEKSKYVLLYLDYFGSLNPLYASKSCIITLLLFSHLTCYESIGPRGENTHLGNTES